jgi:hypothetical protein
MNGSALSGFVGGLQQGYDWVRDQNRKGEDDDFAKKERGRVEKKWDREDAHQAEIDELNKTFFPSEAKTAPAPAIGVKPPDAGGAAMTELVPEQAAPEVRSLNAPPQAKATQASATVAGPQSPAPAIPAQGQAVAVPVVATQESRPVALTGGMRPPAAQDQPGQAQPQGMPIQPNQMTSMNNSLEYMIQRAAINLKHGVDDGKTLMSLYKFRDTSQKEGLDDAIRLLNMGDNEGAMRKYNSTGQSTGWTVKSSVDGVFKYGGADIPTKLVTVQDANGTVRTINTAQAMVQNQTIDKLITQAQKGVEQDDKRADNEANRRIQQQNADTQENYRRDVAAAKTAASQPQAAPVWDDKADTFLKQRYTVTDPVSGAVTVDGDGLQFGKAVALSRARTNGGDATSGLGYAFDVDNRLKQSAGDDPAKLRQLRNDYLRSIAPPRTAPAAAASQSPEFSRVQAAYDAGQAGRNADQRAILERELAAETNPDNRAALEREIARLPAAAPVTAREKLAPAGGIPKSPAAPAATNGRSTAERDQRIAEMNRLSGNSMEARRSAIAMRETDAKENFDSQLAQLRPNMPRAEKFKLMEWFDAHEDSLSNEQRKRLREAKAKVG